MPDPSMDLDSRRPGNRLLAHLSDGGYRRLLPYLQPVALKFEQVLYEVGSPIDCAYFITSGIVSALTLMEDGSAIEVATIGNEGLVALPAFLGVKTSPHRILVQHPGDALRMPTDVLLEQAGRDESLRRLLSLYHTAFLMQVSQSVACNGLHTVKQRCCRWILMARDRVPSDELLLTHEFLAMMLGVRRSTVTEVLHPLQEEGLIDYSRGKITILDRGRLEGVACECYRVVKNEFDRLLGTP